MSKSNDNSTSGETTGRLIGKVVEDFDKMDVVQVSFNKWLVTSWRDGDPQDHRVRQHTVDLTDGSCTCEAMRYESESEMACAHIAKVVHIAPSTRSADQHLVDKASADAEKIQQSVDDIQRLVTGLQADKEAATSSNGASPSQDTSSGLSAEEAAEKLQDEFDQRVDGMEAVAGNNVVWVSNGSQDNGAPDWTFDAWLTGPDMVNYDPDGEHEEPPEYYLKNYVAVDDVDRYISEVLE